jgi:hypothetical protein
VIIEESGFNNSLAGYDNCQNANNNRSAGGINALTEWANIYLQNATGRFQPMIEGFDWTINDTFAAQVMCPYETVGILSRISTVLLTQEQGRLRLQ